MARCTFCGNTLVPGTGKLFVKNDGKLIYYCSRKCEQHATKLKRQARYTKWTRTARKEKSHD